METRDHHQYEIHQPLASAFRCVICGSLMLGCGSLFLAGSVFLVAAVHEAPKTATEEGNDAVEVSEATRRVEASAALHFVYMHPLFCLYTRMLFFCCGLVHSASFLGVVC